MADIAHYWGEDVTRSSTGDYLISAAIEEANERVLRRLLTSPGEYVWHPEYGAGLPREVGNLADVRRIKGLVLEHLAQEEAVSRNPLPAVRVSQLAEGVFVHIEFTVSSVQERSILRFGLEN